MEISEERFPQIRELLERFPFHQRSLLKYLGFFLITDHFNSELSLWLSRGGSEE